MRFERWLGLFKRIQGKHCDTMTRSSQKFDMDYGIGRDVIVFLMLRYFSCHLVLKCIGNEDGWLWECPCRRVEHLSFFVFDVSIICYPWREYHACFFSCPFWPSMEISKVKLFSDSRPARKHLLGRRRRRCLFLHNLKQLTVSKVGDLIAIKRCQESLPPVFLTHVLDGCCLQALRQIEAATSKDEAATSEVGAAFVLSLWMFLVFGRHANQCVLKDDLGFSRESTGRTVIQWQDQWIME